MFELKPSYLRNSVSHCT